MTTLSSITYSTCSTKLYFSCAYFVLKIDKTSSLVVWFYLTRFNDDSA